MKVVLRKHSKFFLLFKATRRSATTCTLKQDPPPLNTTSVSSSSSSNHKLLCFSLVEQLLDRGLMSSAQKVFRRMIAQSTSVPDAISVADFAIVRGMDLDLGGYGALIAKLIEFDQPQMVLSLYRSNIAATDPAVFHDVIAITSLPLLLGAAQQGKYFSGFDCNCSSTTSTASAIDIDGRKRDLVGLAGLTRPLTALRRSLLIY